MSGLSPVRYGGTPKRRLSLASDSNTPTPLQPVVLDKQLSRELGKTSLLLVTNYVKLLLISEMVLQMCVCVSGQLKYQLDIKNATLLHLFHF